MYVLFRNFYHHVCTSSTMTGSGFLSSVTSAHQPGQFRLSFLFGREQREEEQEIYNTINMRVKNENSDVRLIFNKWMQPLLCIRVVVPLPSLLFYSHSLFGNWLSYSTTLVPVNPYLCCWYIYIYIYLFVSIIESRSFAIAFWSISWIFQP